MLKPVKVEGAGELLKAIIKKCGGISAVARKVNVSRQVVNSWLVRGKIPLKRVGEVATALGVSAWGLNYVDLCSLTFGQGKQVSWKAAVEGYDFPKEVETALLRLSPTPRVELVKCQKSSSR